MASYLVANNPIILKKKWAAPEKKRMLDHPLSRWYNEIEQASKKYDYKNDGPFNLFAVIDGHGKHGHAVSMFVKNHLLEVVFRNKNLMVYRRFEKGMKQVIIKMEELLRTPRAQDEMREFLGFPKAKAGTMYKEENEADSCAIDWCSGASLTLVITNSDEVHCSNVGDSKVVIRSSGRDKFKVLTMDHKVRS